MHDADRQVAEVFATMLESNTWLPVIAYAEAAQPQRIVEAVASGTADYIEWPFEPFDLQAAIVRSQARADTVISIRMRELRARQRMRRLTPRERQVLMAIADGLSNRLIGERLSISPRTVEIHRANMLNKLGASHTSEAIRTAIEACLDEAA